MPYIQKHITALNEWIGRVQEVVVVDSESTDGTIEYIKAHLSHINVVYLDHPPGLYESWNAAIQQVSSQYTYIATINDNMPFETLLSLYKAAENYGADVVLSEPTIFSPRGSRKPKQWPIHRFVQSHELAEPYVISPLELLVWNSIGLPGTLIGSSASNLYRTSALHEQPFPYDYGHAGDSAWALLSMISKKWVFVPFGRSTFLHHGGECRNKLGRSLRKKLHLLASLQAEHISEKLVDDADAAEVFSALTKLSICREQREELVLEYNKYRSGRFPWFLLPRVWMLRARKQRSNREIDLHIDSLLHLNAVS